MLELKTTQLKVKFNEKVYEMRHPSISELRTYEGKLKDTVDEKKDELDCIFAFLETLGLPKTVSSVMEVDHLRQIQESFITKK